MVFATMKRMVLVGVFMMIALVPAMARNQNKSLTIPRPCVIQGKDVVAGTYTAQFVDDQEGQLVILDGRKEIARLPYKIMNLSKPATGDTVVFSNINGTRSLSRIEFKGLATALVFE